MEPLTAALRHFFHQHVTLAPGTTVVVAVSGGPDSLALLHALHTLRHELRLTLHAAHLDHMLRGAQSAAEASFVAETARAWGISASIERADVRALANQRRENLHAAARLVRYAFLARVAAEVGATAVATAHHADDQAETVLAHLLRGAGPEGLSGIRPVIDFGLPILDFGLEDVIDPKSASGNRQSARPSAAPPAMPSASGNLKLIRPLLPVTKEEIESYCAANGLEPRRDPSNEDRRYTRARIRHDLLPRLIEYNPRIIETLSRTAAACAEEHAFVTHALDAAWPALTRLTPDAIVFVGAVWSSLHPALQREALRRAHVQLATGVTLGLEDVERARELAGGRVGRRAELPGGVTLTAGYGGDFVVAQGAPPEQEGPQLPVERAELPAAGALALGGGWRLHCAEGVAATPRDRWEIYLDAGRAGEELAVRRRRPGDMLRPAGGSGTRKLQDLLVDARVPRALRAAWPLVVAGETILWVPGVRASEGFVAAPGIPAIHVWIEPPLKHASFAL